MSEIYVKLINHPEDDDWIECKRRTLVTIGKSSFKQPPTMEWKHKLLKAHHSPIRSLMFGFYIECPYWVSVHLCRHIHAQPYVSTQRNDRQDVYDRNNAPQDAPVKMIWDMNAEELITIANKRLCNCASAETRALVAEMCRLVLKTNPEFEGLLVPLCEREHGCNEMFPCGRYEALHGKEK